MTVYYQPALLSLAVLPLNSCSPKKETPDYNTVRGRLFHNKDVLLNHAKSQNKPHGRLRSQIHKTRSVLGWGAQQQGLPSLSTGGLCQKATYRGQQHDGTRQLCPLYTACMADDSHARRKARQSQQARLWISQILVILALLEALILLRIVGCDRVRLLASIDTGSHSLPKRLQPCMLCSSKCTQGTVPDGEVWHGQSSMQMQRW